VRQLARLAAGCRRSAATAGHAPRAKRELVRAAQGRDRSLRVRMAEVVRFDSRPALQIVFDPLLRSLVIRPLPR
jgi:hypothetical protein